MDMAVPARVQHQNDAKSVLGKEESMVTSTTGRLSDTKLLRVVILGGLAVLFALSLVVPSVREFMGRIAEYLPR